MFRLCKSPNLVEHIRDVLPDIKESKQVGEFLNFKCKIKLTYSRFPTLSCFECYIFWVIPRRLNFMCRRFETLCSIRWNRECSETSAHKTRRRESAKKEYYEYINIYEGKSISKLQIVIEKRRMRIMPYKQHLYFNVISTQI
jgi:hypothetical protein